MRIRESVRYGGWLIVVLTFVSTVGATSYAPWFTVDAPHQATSAPTQPGQIAAAPSPAEPRAVPAPSVAVPTPGTGSQPQVVHVLPITSELARAITALAAAGVPVTAPELQALATRVGLGNAVRILVYAYASGEDPDEVLGMFESGMGWGEIARALHLTVGPGIGGVDFKHHPPHPNPGHTPPGHHYGDRRSH